MTIDEQLNAIDTFENSTEFENAVAAEIRRMVVREEAQRRFDARKARGLAIPQGILADDPLPEGSQELLKGILLEHGATGIVGEKESGKGLTALEIQYSLVTGAPLWGAIKPSRTVEKTVHFLAEHTSILLQGLYRRLALPATGKIRIFGPEHLGPLKLLVSNGVRREQSIEMYKKLAAGAGLVVFDPLASFIQGEIGENHNTSMRLLIDAMIEIAESTGAACLVLGHQGKPQMANGKPVRRRSYGTRGASATEDALAAVHYLERCDGELFNQCPVYQLRPVHYKGFKARPFKFYRDNETCRQTLLVKAAGGS